ncbi:Extracellular ligand-binding receptor, partial [sediment metagenome]
SKCDSKEGANAASKLINIDQVKIILGGICSSEVLGAKELIEAHKTINFCWGSSPEITKDSDYIFRNSPSDLIAGMQLADYVYKNGYTQIGILTVNDVFTDTFFNSFKKEFQVLGGQILIEENNSRDSKDFRTSILKIKTKQPRALIFLHIDPKNTGLMAKQIRDQGLTGQLFSAYTFSSPEAIEAAGYQNVKGLVYIDTPGLDMTNQTAKNFIEKYQSTYGDVFPGGQFYAAAAYDSVYLIARTIELCEEKTDCIKEILKGTKFSGALGEYSIDDNGDVVGIKYSIRTIE